jgi:hypothetical protein
VSSNLREEQEMTANRLLRLAAPLALGIALAAGAAAAQQGQGGPPVGGPGMGPGMMRQGQGMGPMQGQAMGQGRMGEMPMTGMHGHTMKIMFAIADVNGDGGLSFEEVTTIHKRIFDTVDANKDGKVTSEEVQAFMRE